MCARRTALLLLALQGRPVRDVIVDAAYCIIFLGMWRRDVVNNPRADIRTSYITTETHSDMLLACNAVILTAMVFGMHYPGVKIDWSRMSSRFSEYVFQVRAHCYRPGRVG
jgi:hypothetical protein